jgi:hypothetical protein
MSCAWDGRGEESVQGFDGKARRKETTWKTKVRWEDGIRMDVREIGWGGGSGSSLNTVLKLRVLAPRI